MGVAGHARGAVSYWKKGVYDHCGTLQRAWQCGQLGRTRKAWRKAMWNQQLQHTHFPRLMSRGPIEAVGVMSTAILAVGFPRLMSRGPIEAVHLGIARYADEAFRGS